MIAKLKSHQLRVSVKTALIGVIFVLSLGLVSSGFVGNRKAVAATNSTINFQARVLTSAGALIPDGDYNVEFKIYDTVSSGASAQGVCSLNSSSDDCWWLETRTGANKVTVKNGYISANLGSVTAFGSSIPWDQDLYLTMNIGGTGTPTWDGEMTGAASARMKMSAVPYAYAASKLQVTSGANTTSVSITTPTGARSILFPDASGTVALASGGSFTSNGVLYGNGTAQIQATAAGTTGQCLVATTSAAPTWGSCAGTGSGSTLQAAYNNSTNPEITLNSTNGALTIRDNATPLGANLFEVQNNAGSTNYFAVTSSGISSSGTLTISGAGNSYIAGSLGLGVVSPQGALSIANGAWITGVDSAGSGFVNVLQVNTNNEIQFGAAINVDGGIVLPTNAGQITFSDLPVDSSAAAATPESYSFRIGSTNVMTIYAQSDGSGGVQNTRVAIGNSISPGNLLSVNSLTTADSAAQASIGTNGTTNKGLVIQGVASQSANLFEVQDSGGTNKMFINSGSLGSSNASFSIYTNNTTQSLVISNSGPQLPTGLAFVPYNGVSSNVALTAKGVASQSGNLFEAQNNSGTPLVAISSDGRLGVGAAPAAGYNLDVSGAGDIRLSQGSGTRTLTINSSGLAFNTVATFGSGTWGSIAELEVYNQSNTRVGMFVRGIASQSADLFQLQDSSANVNAAFNSTGAQLTLGRVAASGTVTQGKLVLSDGTTDNFSLTLQSATLSGSSKTITFPNETGTVCTTGSVCTGYAAATGGSGYVQFAPASAQVDSSTNSSIFINKTGASGNILQLQKSGTNVLAVTNSGQVQVNAATNCGTSALCINGKIQANTTLPAAATGTLTTGAAPEGVQIVGNYAYVINNTASTLQIIDVTVPGSMAVISSTATATNPTDVTVSGKYAYVTANSGNYLQIFDISNPTSPASVGTLSTPFGGSVYRAVVMGKYLYTVNSSNVMFVVDISNPANPTLIAQTSAAAGTISSIYGQGKYIYMLAGTQLKIYDVSNPFSPSNVGNLTYTNAPYNAAINGRYLYTTENTSIFRVVDISNPAAPASVGTVTMSGLNVNVIASGSVAYVYGSVGTQIIDVSTPTAPAVLSSTTNFTAFPVTGYRLSDLSGRYLYVVSPIGNTLRSIDLSGSYVQSLEAGHLLSQSTSTQSLLVSGDTTLAGNAQIGNSLQVAGNIGASGQVIFQNTSNSTTAFSVQNSSGYQIFNVDTSAGTNLISNPGFEVNTTGHIAKGSSTISRVTTQKHYGIASEQVVTTAVAGDGESVTGFTSALSAGTYTLSFSVLLNSGTWAWSNVQVGYNNGSDNNATCSGNVLPASGNVPTNGWQRVACTFTTTGTTTSVYIRQADATVRTFFLDALQLESGATLTPYQATGGTIQLRGNITSPTIFKNTTNSTSAFQIATSAGSTLLNVDTLNGQIASSASTTSTTGLSFNLSTLTVAPGSSASTSSYYSGNFTSSMTANANLGSATLGGVFGGALANTSGTVANGIGGFFQAAALSGATITNAYGIQIGALIGTSGAGVAISNGSLSTNNTNLLIGTTTIPSGNFSIYNSSAYNNVFAGNLRVGSTTAPTVALDVTGAALISTTLGVTGLTTATGGLTVTAGQNFTVNGDVFTDLTGSGLIVSSNALTVDATSGGAGFIKFAQSAAQVDSSTNVSAFINKTGASGNILQLQKSGVDVFVVDNNGKAATTATYTSTSGFSRAQTASVVINTPASASTAWFSGVYGGALSLGTSNLTGATIVGLQGNASVFNGAVVGTAIGGYFANGASASTITNNFGVQVDASTGTITNNAGIAIADQTAASSKNTNLLIGTTTIPTTGNFSIYNSSAYNNYFAGNLGIGDTTPAALLTVGNGDLFQVSSTGTVFAKNSSNSTTSFQIQPSGSTTPVLNVDTTNSRVGIGTNAPGYALDVRGDVFIQGSSYLRFVDGNHYVTATGGVGMTIYDVNKVDITTGVLTANTNTFTLNAASGTATANIVTQGSADSGYLVFKQGATSVAQIQTVGTNQGSAATNFDYFTSLNIRTGYGGATVQSLSGTGQALFKNTSNSTTAFQIQNSTGVSLFTADTTNSRLIVANDSWFAGTDSAGTGVVNVFKVNSSNQIQVGGSLNVDGGFIFPTDAGQVTFTDLPISTSATAGTKESYTLRVGSSNVLTVYGEADGSGNAQNTRVGIGSSASPANLLSVNSLTVANSTAQFALGTGATGNKGQVIQAVNGQTADIFEIQDYTGNNLVSVNSTGVIAGNNGLGLKLQAVNNAGTLSGTTVTLDNVGATFSGNISSAGGITSDTGGSGSILTWTQGSMTWQTNTFSKLTAAYQLQLVGSATGTLVYGSTSSANVLVVRAAASQSVDQLQIQDSSSNVNAAFNSTGAQLTLGRVAASGTVTQGKLVLSDGTTDNFSLTLQSATLSGSSKTITFPNETGTVCTTGSVCTGYAAATGGSGYVQFAPASAQVDSSTNSSIFINKTGASGNILQLQKSGVDSFTLTNAGAATFAGGSLAVTNASATGINVTGTNPQLQVGSGTFGFASSGGAYSSIAAINDSIFKATAGNLILSAQNATGNIYLSTGSTDSAKLTILNSGKLVSNSALNTTSNENGATYSVTVTPGSASTATQYGSNLTISSSSTNMTGDIIGTYSQATYSAAATTGGKLFGAQYFATVGGSAGASQTTGFSGYSINSSSGTVATAMGAFYQVQNTGAGTITQGIGQYISNSYKPSGNITRSAGLVVETQTKGATNSNVNILIKDETGFGTPVTIPSGTQNYSIYNSSTYANYFAGKLGLASTGAANLLSVNTLTTADSLAQIALATGATTNKGLVIQGAASQSANLFELQDSSANVNGAFNSGGAQLTLGRASNVTGAIKLANGTNAQVATLQAGRDDNYTFGYNALNTLTAGTAISNIGIGTNAGLSITTGGANIAIGKDALHTNLVSSRVIALGSAAGYTQNTANDVIYIGDSAGYNDVGGGQTVVIGSNAGFGTGGGATVLYQDVIIGHNAASSATDAYNNVIIGYGTAATLTSGDNNILIGSGVNVASGSTSNFLNIGNTLYGDVSAGTLYTKSTSATAFQVQDGGGVAKLIVDTSNSRVYVGPTAGDTIGTLLVVGKKTNSGDPTGVSGAIYYNAAQNKFRCYTSNQWQDCMGSNIPQPGARKWGMVIPDRMNSTTMNRSGNTTLFTENNGGTSDNQTEDYYIKYTTPATNNAIGGLGYSSNVTRETYRPKVTTRVRMGATITSERVWFGLFSTDPTAAGGYDASNTATYVGLRYSTSAGDTTWQCASSDGTTASVTNTGVTVTASHYYDLILDWQVSGTLTCMVYDNGGAPTIINKTTNIVTSNTTLLGFTNMLTNLTTSARDYSIAYVGIERN